MPLNTRYIDTVINVEGIFKPRVNIPFMGRRFYRERFSVSDNSDEHSTVKYQTFGRMSILRLNMTRGLVHRAAPNWTLISSTELAEKGGASHEEQGRGNRRMEGRRKEKKEKKRNVEGKRCCVCGTAGTPTLIRYRRSRRSKKNPSQASLEKIE